jgi:hypothetical protein
VSFSSRFSKFACFLKMACELQEPQQAKEKVEEAMKKILEKRANNE